VVLISTSLGLEDCGEVTAALLIPDMAARVQVNVAPGVALEGVYVKVELLQIAVGLKVLLSTGVGLTVTMTFWVLLHPLAEIVKA
jgi:hypothetical protein